MGAIALALFHGANAVFMLLDPRGWLSFVVGRAIEGPLPGAHFIADVGWAFLASAFGFLLFALKPSQWGAAAAGAAFPLLHALMHGADMAQGHANRLGFDLALITAPALLGLLVAWPARTRD
ncbi:hypothetical protein U91I_01096 [alpha proteobacterium U9-1i]|nr:hypothetical protein U91I_01096 [alpha proteobacterium U9-1i]